MVRFRITRHLTVFLLLLLLMPQLAAGAQKQKNEAPRKAERSGGARAAVSVDIFLERDRDAIRRFYSANPGSLPPGLAKRGGDLPPGLEKQLRRKGHLPPGLDKRIVAFPADLERQLAPLKPGLMRGIIEGRAIIYNAKTAVVLDAFQVF